MSVLTSLESVFSTDLFATLAVAATLLVALGAAVTRALRFAPASSRHLVWQGVLAALLVLAVARTTVPPIPVAVLPARPNSVTTLAPRDVERSVSEASGRGASTESVRTSALPAGVATSWSWTATRVLLLAWGLGAALLLLRLLLAMVRVHRVIGALPDTSDGTLLVRVQRLARALGVARPIRVRLAPTDQIPLTAGVVWPVVVLPPAAAQWSDERRDAVLLHELGHVQRLDVASILVAQCALALCWWHPLVWWAAARARAEAERACDDVVLAGGVRPSTYAETLVQLTRSLVAPARTGALALAMAEPSELESRLVAILDPVSPRRRLSRGARTVGAVAVLAVAPLSAITPVPRANPVWAAASIGAAASPPDGATADPRHVTTAARVPSASATVQPSRRATTSDSSARSAARADRIDPPESSVPAHPMPLPPPPAAVPAPPPPSSHGAETQPPPDLPTQVTVTTSSWSDVWPLCRPRARGESIGNTSIDDGSPDDARYEYQRVDQVGCFRVYRRGRADLIAGGTDVRLVGAAAALTIEETRNGVTTRAELREGRGRTLWRDGQRVPDALHAELWSPLLARMWRETGLDAEARVALLMTRGAGALVEELPRLAKSSVRGIYLRAALRHTALTGPDVSRLLPHILAIESESDRAALLLRATRRAEPSALTEIVAAAASIRDRDKRTTLCEALLARWSEAPAMQGALRGAIQALPASEQARDLRESLARVDRGTP